MAVILRDSVAVRTCHDNDEKINSWVSFGFLFGYVDRMAAFQAAGAPV